VQKALDEGWTFDFWQDEETLFFYGHFRDQGEDVKTFSGTMANLLLLSCYSWLFLKKGKAAPEGNWAVRKGEVPIPRPDPPKIESAPDPEDLDPEEVLRYL
jgi:hypothetical protein